MIVVSDATPLNALIRIGHIDVLALLFGEVIIPPSVASELSQAQTPEVVRSWLMAGPSWLEVRKPTAVDSSIAPDVGEAILVQTFVVVVLGGVGSFPGAIIGGLIAGEIISITSMFNPGYAYIMLFVAMTLVLVFRPHGLLGTAGRE